MIKLRYPGSMKTKPPGASLIELDLSIRDTWYFKWDGEDSAVSMFADKFYVNSNASKGNLAGSMPVVLKTQTLNLDRLEQRSSRFDYLNLFDTVSEYPKLHSGRSENPCHHESVSGDISLQPRVPNNVDPNLLYPCYFNLDSTHVVASGSSHYSCSKIKGLALASFHRVIRNGVYSPWFLRPICWIESEFKQYDWLKSGPRSLKEAQEQGLVTETTIKKTPSYISYPYAVIYLADATNRNERVYMYGQQVPRVYCNPFSKLNYMRKYTFASSFSLPNIDLIIEQLTQDVPAMFAEVGSKLKYPDEIWYNLILSGAKEIKRLEMNNIANLLEIPGMIRSFDKIYKQFISFKNGSKVYKNPATKKIIKKAACIYLGIHYGVKLTVMDIQDIIKTFRDNPSLLRQLRRRVVSYSSTSIDGNLYNCKSCMKPRIGREITDMRDLCRILGIELSPLNAWDLIPWSFVVDWFIPISDILDSLENSARLESTYDLEYLLESVSREETIAWKDYSLRIKIYDRYITDHMPQFGFMLGETSGLNNHIIEASALIINSVD